MSDQYERDVIRVLVVEDSEFDAAWIARLLMTSDEPRCEVSRVARAHDAKILIEHSNFDVLFLDLFLPDSKGIESVYKLATTAFSKVPVIVYSGEDNDEYATEAVNAGCFGYLVKGKSSPEVVVDTLRRALQASS